MTTTTVSVEETRTVEEELTLCDECQREVDPNGSQFDNANGVSLHFCSECLQDMTDGEVNPKYVERAQEWLDTSWENQLNRNTTVSKSLEGEVKGAAKFSKSAFGIGAVIAGAGLLMAIGGMALPFGPLFPVAYGIGALAALAFNAAFMGDASNAIDKANENVK